jgi:hypothetical protein
MGWTLAEVLGLAKPRVHCSGKTKFTTVDEALVVAERMRSRTDGSTWSAGTLGVYCCRECGAWHIGHRTQAVEPRAVGTNL